MHKWDILNRKDYNNVVPYRLQMLIHVVIWFLAGAVVAHVIQAIIHIAGFSFQIDWIGMASFFAIVFGYIGWILRKISTNNKE